MLFPKRNLELDPTITNGSGSATLIGRSVDNEIFHCSRKTVRLDYNYVYAIRGGHGISFRGGGGKIFQEQNFFRKRIKTHKAPGSGGGGVAPLPPPLWPPLYAMLPCPEAGGGGGQLTIHSSHGIIIIDTRFLCFYCCTIISSIVFNLFAALLVPIIQNVFFLIQLRILY